MATPDPERITVDLAQGSVIVDHALGRDAYPLGTAEAFAAVSQAWLRCGWDVKYVYTFSWMGRPVIQLPEDLVRAQEVIYAVKPEVIVETGVAHGGSLVFYATLCKAIGRGRVIGVDVKIRPENRRALEAHELAGWMHLIEGDSTAPEVVALVTAQIRPRDRVMVILDSAHTRAHVQAELEAYASLVSPGSYIVVTDAVMKDFARSPRAGLDWSWNNPAAAVREFLERHTEFTVDRPSLPFNESLGLTHSAVTYWPGGWLKRRIVSAPEG
jgi:cephalosporin hydroxylase